MRQLVAMLSAGRYAQLERTASDLSRQYPSSGSVWKVLGVSLKMQHKDALPALQKATELLPNDAEAHSNLGIALLDAGRIDDAMASYRRALQIRPDLAEVRHSLGNVLRGLGRLDEAATSYHQAIEIKPDYADAHYSLGVVLRLQGRTAEAEASCRRALEINPNLAAAVSALAEAHADRGEFSEAEALFKRATSMQPNLTEAWVGIARLRKMTRDDAPWLAEAQRIAGQPLRPREAISLHYAIGKYFDDVQDFEQAFSHYRRANELTKPNTARYDRQRMTQDIGQLIHVLDREWVNQARTHGVASARPVLVVGMQRSGTTLAEQILASHPQAVGAGELRFWNTASAPVRSAARRSEAIGEILGKLSSDYLRLLQDLSADALRVIDKMPGNFLHLGMIHAALPNARIIHMRRNPLDTCLSIYFQDFDATFSYANDLDDLAHYYSEYVRVMAHWRAILPEDAILDVPYEGLVEDQEAWSRKMLEFVGLPWDPQCLDFERTSRSVVTASKWQVRQKISKSSVARWRNYEGHVGALLNLLQLDAGV
jgi:tetratricopeptide (TPR) repeat protein